MLLFFTVLIPAIIFIRYGLASTAMSLLAIRCAEVASTSTTYQSAQESVRAAARDLSHSPLWALSGLEKDAIKSINVYIDEQIMSTGQTDVFGPDRPMKKPISPSTNCYEYDVRISYSVAPMFPSGGLPLIGRIPVVTAPGTYTASAASAVEYPDGLPAHVQ
jgi:hypothetical protein